MADTAYRANLSAPNIPVDPLTQGRSVIMKAYDNNYAPNLASKTDDDKDIGLPQVLYVANALPTEYGYRSMQYAGPKAKCDGTPYAAFPVRSGTNSALLIHTTEGYLFRLKKSGEAASIPQFVPLGTFTGAVTYATVAGETYIYFANNACYRYDFPTQALVGVTLTGLTPANILGITGTGGYLLAWSSDAIAWSSIVNATDFVPSLDTGAGGGSVEGARGALTVCVSNSYGVFIFTANNCVSAQLSNNARFPFNFKEIVGSSGALDTQQVSFEGNQNLAYSYTPTGFQQLAHAGAKTVWTELFDSGDMTPIWTEATVISSSVVTGSPRKIQGAKLTVVGNRYLCISVLKGTIYNSAWVFDTALNRWGRLVKNHLEIFEDEDHNIALITSDGRYVKCDTAFASTTFPVDTDSVPYIVFGKYQYSRQRLCQMQCIEAENLFPRTITDPVTGLVTEQNHHPEVYIASTMDGKSGYFASTYRDARVSEAYARYLTHKVGINHLIMWKGDFVLNSMVLTFNNHGGR